MNLNASMPDHEFRAHGDIPHGGGSHVQMSEMEMRSLKDELNHQLDCIAEKRTLTALFQPVVDLEHGSVAGFEGLIRGPSNSALHAPLQLFRAAELCGRAVEIEHLCRRATLESFARLDLAGDIFLNVSPECLLLPSARHGETLGALHELGIDPQRVVIELTEQQPTYDYEVLRQAVDHYRAMGFRIAIDDLGEGFSSLRLWSELRPEFVKIDMHFIQGCDRDFVKKQFLYSIQEIARNAGCQVIAEGIETAGEFHCVRGIGIARGQGYFFSRPAVMPPTRLDGEVAAIYIGKNSVPPARRPAAGGHVLEKMLHSIQPVTAESTADEVFVLFERNPEMRAVAVVRHGLPIGLIARYEMVDNMARPYRHELYGRKSCTRFMDKEPLIVDIRLPLAELSELVVNAHPRHLISGFIITDGERYLGIGSVQDLVREVTSMQMEAARYANPLTQLPGNVPINQHIDNLLAAGEPCAIAYCDLDHFKPFNDVHGYARGDDVIRLTARVLGEVCGPDRDFLGHIGGDDFVLVFRSEDWQARCERALRRFGEEILGFFSQDDIERGGYVTENRKGEMEFHALTSLSIGVAEVRPGMFRSHLEVSVVAAEVKKKAKGIKGNSLFVNQRVY